MNPARELHTLLLGWSEVDKSKTIQGSRGWTRGGEQEDYVHGQIRAGWLLGETERAITSLELAGEDVTSFRTFFPSWWTAVVLPNESWGVNQQNPKVVIAPETLATLASFAAYLDKTAIRPYGAGASAFAQSRAAADDILTVLREQEDLADDERTYAFQLLDEIRRLLDAKDLNVNADLIRRVNELRGWLAAYEDFLEQREPGSPIAKKLRKAARVLLPPGRLLFGAAGYALGAAANISQITTGG